MMIPILTFALLLSVVFAIGILVGYFCSSGIYDAWVRIKKWCGNLRNRLVDYWFVLVFVISSIYVFSNFGECIDLAFTEKFNGKNLIFLFWLALIIFPMFESFEGFGISIKKRKQDKVEQSLTEDFRSQIENLQRAKEVQDE